MVRRLSLASLDSGAESPVYVLVPSASAGRGTYANGDAPGWMPPTQVVTGRTATRHNLRHVGHRPAKRKMVCKGHPCIYAADGIPMTTRFASPWAVPRGLRSPRKLTDVHGREG
jgi:hypothetical protein